MKIEEIILKEHSKQQALKLLRFVLKDENNFNDYIRILLKNEAILSQRAAWILPDLAKEKPEWIRKYIPKLLDLLDQQTHPALTRNITKTFSFLDFEDKIAGKIYQKCFEIVQNSSQSIAARAYSMSVLYTITRKYPELSRELKILLTEVQKEGNAACTARSKNILLALKKAGI